MTKLPLVSVVIPVFNGEPFVQLALASVLKQTYANIEIVMTDGGSTDGSLEWLERYSDHPIIKGYLPAGSGAAANWTLACELSTGKYVKLLCQDDLIYPDAIALQVHDLEANPEARIAFAQRDIIDARGKMLSRARGCQGLSNGTVDGRYALLACYRAGTNIFGEPATVLFERSSMLNALPWEDNEPFLLDVLFYSKILSLYPGVVRKEPIGAFRVSSSSWSTRLVSEHRQQFRSWQDQTDQLLAEINWMDRLIATVNREKVTLLRRAAYAWLKLTRKMN